jgi:hypothetical protein
MPISVSRQLQHYGNQIAGWFGSMTRALGTGGTSASAQLVNDFADLGLHTLMVGLSRQTGDISMLGQAQAEASSVAADCASFTA